MNSKNYINAVGNYLKANYRNINYLPYCYRVQDYLGWYMGECQWHKYKIFNGKKWKNCIRKNLNMAKTCCEDFASLVLNEKVKIILSNRKSQIAVDNVLKDNNFWVMSNQLVELSYALGTGAFVESWVDDKVVIDYIHGDFVFPLKWDNGEITECAFAIVGGDTLNDKITYTLLVHTKEDVEFEDGTIDERYVIKKIYLDADGRIVKPYDMVSELNSEEEDEEIFITNSKKPLFQIIKPNIVNNYDKTNPLGMSIFGNAITILQNIDMEYDSLYSEFEQGKKKTYVKSGIKTIDIKSKDDTTIKDVIDPNDAQYYQIGDDEWENGKPPLYTSNEELRVDNHINGINLQLQLLSRKVGLGDGFYSFNGNTVARTATEIISVNSSLFRNVRKFELIIEKALIDMSIVILSLLNDFGGGNYNLEQEISVNFDDSIIEDTDKVSQNALLKYNAGLIDKVQYFVETENMTREQAKKYVEEMDMTDTYKVQDNLLGGLGGFNVNE
jgi:A118 family predicted phage portal protein